ncbi:MAG: hypothetical protein IJX71_06250 [Oscillospiraceae bacterium]|nr:hypothetical protein [Oscillospiraceae bacterium]
MKCLKQLLPLVLILVLLTGCGRAAADRTDSEVPSEPKEELTESEEAARETGDDLTIGTQTGNLLENASPETSCLILYYFDGETVTTRALYDEAREQEILDELNLLPAEPAEQALLANWQIPCYGLWICDKNGYDLSIAWSDGLWLTQDGAVYQVDADFGGYWEQLAGEDEETGLSVLYFPNSEYLSPYDSRFLSEAKDPYAIMDMPLDVTMELVGIEGNIATLIIDNHSGEEFSYGMYYALQRQIDGTWYEMVMKDDVAFEDVAIILPDMEQSEVTCDLSIFGELETGTYRIVKDGMVAVFGVEEDGFCSYPLRQE